jgi:hypothetical protein
MGNTQPETAFAAAKRVVEDEKRKVAAAEREVEYRIFWRRHDLLQLSQRSLNRAEKSLLDAESYLNKLRNQDAGPPISAENIDQVIADSPSIRTTNARFEMINRLITNPWAVDDKAAMLNPDNSANRNDRDDDDPDNGTRSKAANHY